MIPTTTPLAAIGFTPLAALGPAPLAPIGPAADMGSIAFSVARLALAVAGLLFLLYALFLVILTLCARWVRR
ncbi:hypothetical protein [Streptosporangium sp. NPDC000396]|uniref:hypothetical protein n=1 Tax=Streptosporangium sp. NPDC000396 TaxID=3366185 RepID=UPI00368985AA